MALNAFASLTFYRRFNGGLSIGYAAAKHSVDHDHQGVCDRYDGALATNAWS